MANKITCGSIHMLKTHPFDLGPIHLSEEKKMILLLPPYSTCLQLSRRTSPQRSADSQIALKSRRVVRAGDETNTHTHNPPLPPPHTSVYSEVHLFRRSVRWGPAVCVHFLSELDGVAKAEVGNFNVPLAKSYVTCVCLCVV